MRGLNAPYGARCFLTQKLSPHERSVMPSLNAPYGARCFLTVRKENDRVKGQKVCPESRIFTD